MSKRKVEFFKKLWSKSGDFQPFYFPFSMVTSIFFFKLVNEVGWPSSTRGLSQIWLDAQ
jgi:hypothetical protein